MRAEWLSIVLIATLALLAWWLLAQRRSGAGAAATARLRYRPQPLMAPEVMPMLGYLHTVFPGQAVLTAVPLVRMLAPLHPEHAPQAEAALQPLSVDYVVCDHQGMPQFAFDVERFHLSKAEEHEAALKQKNRLLQSAGIRLVFLRQSVDRMPRPADLRRQLDLADLREAGLERAASSHHTQMLHALKQELDAADARYQSTHYRESEVVMGLGSLMELGKPRTPHPSTAPATPADRSERPEPQH